MISRFAISKTPNTNPLDKFASLIRTMCWTHDGSYATPVFLEIFIGQTESIQPTTRLGESAPQE